MSFVDTFGDIVGYSIYFVVGGIWLLFLSVGACFVIYHIVYFCSGFRFWGIWKDHIVATLRVSRAQAVVAGSDLSRAMKSGLAKLSQLPSSFVASVRMGRENCRQTDIAMAETGTRNSSETPLLHEHDSFSDDETLTESKIEIVVEPPSQSSVEQPQISRNDGCSQGTGPD
ncbi:hypothetical protein BJV82DRAFT_666333 [Fennellomyces sp. T-0311]|nr:hypothetical protein BJV82DRAFT_666333 [Fennellomyces sp. T-0311]